MINLDGIREAFETRLNGTTVGMPVQYENVPDCEPLITAKENKKQWARLTIREGQAQSVSIGREGIRRYTGLAMLCFFVPQGEGTAGMREIASAVSNFILTEAIPSTEVYTPSFAVNGKEENWFHGTLTIPFQFDQTTT